MRRFHLIGLVGINIYLNFQGKVYLFTESISQLYRSLITIQPWIFFLMQSYEGSEKTVGMALTAVYVIAKVVEILIRLRLFKNATWTLLQSVVSFIYLGPVLRPISKIRMVASNKSYRKAFSL